MVPFNMISIDVGYSNKLISEELILLITRMGKYVQKWINGTETLMISSGENFEVRWINFKHEMKQNLNKLDILNRTRYITANGMMNIVKEKLNENLPRLMDPMHNILKQKIKGMMNFMAKTEMDIIFKNLRRENVFNLSGKPIDPRVMGNL